MDSIPQSPRVFTEKDLFVRVLPSEELEQLSTSPDGELRLQDKMRCPYRVLGGEDRQWREDRFRAQGQGHDLDFQITEAD